MKHIRGERGKKNFKQINKDVRKTAKLKGNR
jgi:hypothetical protein